MCRRLEIEVLESTEPVQSLLTEENLRLHSVIHLKVRENAWPPVSSQLTVVCRQPLPILSTSTISISTTIAPSPMMGTWMQDVTST